MRIKLIISFDGTRFCGWQVQPRGLSIQTLVQKALVTVLRHPIDLTGAGRTDAGVHALGQTAHFDTEISIDLNRLRYSVNALLPVDIRILSAETVSTDFHARYSATGKIYHYHLHLDSSPNPMTRLYRTPVYGAFDLAELKRAASFFIGTHDFAAMANESDRGTAAHDSVRTLLRLDIVEQSGGIRLEFEGDGFLYKMVRNITGTLLDIAAGRRSADEIPSILESRNRRRAGQTAPAQGLFLIQVKY
ncbi:MAG: tRNA pseudouridine synthase [Parachlamydiales bacterium]|nr:tRNA pseudouridine synthase [Parachlamydiales bacterium]